MRKFGGPYWFCKKCGVRLGYQPFHGHEVTLPCWLKRFKDDVPYPYCNNCIKGFKVKHLGKGLCVRPREESDNVPAPAGPGLEGLYS